MRSPLLAALFFVSASSLALAATDDELRQQLVGAWGADEACAEASLVFNADGTFSINEGGSDAPGRPGTWSIAGGVLSGATADGAMPDVMLRIELPKLYFEEGGQVVNELTRCAT